jgi:hypothetical protein
VKEADEEIEKNFYLERGITSHPQTGLIMFEFFG